MAKSSAKGHYQRLRERFLQNAPGSRSEASLLELLLSYSIGKRDVKAATQALLDHFGSLQKIFSSSPDEILQVKGIGQSTVTLLKAVHFFQTSEPDQSATASPQLAGDAKESPTASLLDLINKGAQHKGSTPQSLPEHRNDDQEHAADSISEEKPEQGGPPAELDGTQKIVRSESNKGHFQPFVTSGKNRKLQVSNSYSLEFDQLARVFYFLREQEDCKKVKRYVMCEELGLAESQVKSLISMGAAMGLLKPKSHCLTELGSLIAEHDIFFEQRCTLELCHLIASGAYGNLIWFEFFNTLLPQENALTLDEAKQILQTRFREEYTEKTLKEHVRKELRFLVNAYQEQNLQKLDLLRQTNDGRMYLRRYTQLHPFILAAGLYDFGAKHKTDLLQLKELTEAPGSPAVLFGFDLAFLVDQVEALHQYELVRYETTHNLNQIRLKPYSGIDFVRAYYQGIAPAQFSSTRPRGDSL